MLHSYQEVLLLFSEDLFIISLCFIILEIIMENYELSCEDIKQMEQFDDRFTMIIVNKVM